MKKKIRALLVLSFLFAAFNLSAKEELKVLTDRTDFLVRPLFKHFEETTGIKVHVAYIKKGLIQRLESRPLEADIIITKNADIFPIAKKKGLLAPFSSELVKKRIPTEFIGPKDLWTGISYRGRVLYYSKERVKIGELSGYEALAEPKWKGRICIRSGYHNYNLSLFGQMLEEWGEKKFRKFIKGFHSNLASRPTGNDRAQVKLIYEKKCDVAIANTYYMGIMLSRADQREWAYSAKMYFPDQKKGGVYILSSAAALTKAGRNVQAATKLMEFMTSDFAQTFISQVSYEYPLNSSEPLPAIVKNFAEGQKEVKEGVIKKKTIPLEKVAANREKVIKILNEVNFDK